MMTFLIAAALLVALTLLLLLRPRRRSVFDSTALDAQALAAPKANSRKVAQIEKFRALVETNYKKHLPVTAYAEQLGITSGQLTRLCREELGMSSMDVINARMVHEAQRDLVYTTSSIKQLAYTLGFADETYFGRFFRKHTGLSPREFRAKATDSVLSRGTL